MILKLQKMITVSILENVKAAFFIFICATSPKRWYGVLGRKTESRQDIK